MSGPDRPGRSGPGEWPEDTGDQDVEGTMMTGFRRTRSGVSARFSAAQAGIVRALVGQVADLVGETGTGVAPGSWPGEPGQEAPGRAAGEAPGEGEAVSDEELAAMLGQTGPTEPPDDPVLARLLPDAYSDDPAAAGEFRQYTEQGLRSGKVAAARTVLATLPGGGGRVRLSAEDAHVWLRSLNDVRLALGVRLGITEDYEDQLAETSEEDPRSAYFRVYDWLTFLQETLVRALW